MLGYIGNITIRSYWVLNIFGIFAGFLILIFNIKGNENGGKILLFASLLFIPFILASRYGYEIEQILGNEKDISLSIFGPVSLWWGLVFSALCAVPLAKRFKIDLWETTDLFSFSIAAGGIFARLGCFFNGCCIGNPAPKNFFFGTFFSAYSYAYSIFGNIPLLPVQLFESFAWFIILVVLFVRKNHVAFHGELILLTGFLYSIVRFTLEFFRFHEERHIISGGQIFSLLVFVFALFLWLFREAVLKRVK